MLEINANGRLAPEVVDKAILFEVVLPNVLLSMVAVPDPEKIMPPNPVVVLDPETVTAPILL